MIGLEQQTSFAIPRTVICGCAGLRNITTAIETISVYGITRSTPLVDCHNEGENPICKVCGEEIVVL